MRKHDLYDLLYARCWDQAGDLSFYLDEKIREADRRQKALDDLRDRCEAAHSNRLN